MPRRTAKYHMQDPEPPESIMNAPASNIMTLEQVRLTLSSRAGPVDILRDVSLSVSSGEAVGIVGPSGSGKTSLLMIMGGLERATAGRTQVLGRDFMHLSEDDLARARGANIGIVFQSFHLVPTMTALENVALPLEFAGAHEPFLVAAQALKDVGLAQRKEHFPAQLSGGEQQRVAIARAIANTPRLLLADEPTGNLDESSGNVVMDLIFQLRAERNMTLVLVTHDASLAERCTRVVSMRDGQIASDGRTMEAA